MTYNEQVEMYGIYLTSYIYGALKVSRQ